jgi:ferritin-like metal-binding protein YciE
LPGAREPKPDPRAGSANRFAFQPEGNDGARVPVDHSKKGVIVKLNSITDVMGDQLGDLRSAEMQLIDALPKMAEAATESDLKSAFNNHLKQTREHFARLQEIIGSVDFAVPVEECEAMKGLIAEGEKVINAEGAPEVKDVALIAAAQRVEHYEISAYGTARTLAKELGLSQAESLLDATLDEESDADKLLTKIATGGLIAAGINDTAPR